MSYDTIEFTVAHGVAELALNRPQSLNAFNQAMHREVRAVLEVVRADREIRCLVLTGRGRAFCAGQDLAERAVQDGQAPVDLGESIEKNYNPLIRTLTGLEKPVIAAVNGVAAGAGANIALACDIVLAARSASFIQAFCKLGLVPDSGGTWFLPRLVGLPRAMALAMLGERVSAEQAAQWGMIWRCIDDEQLAHETMNLAHRLAESPTRGLALTKQALLASGAASLEQQLELEMTLQRVAGQTRDFREGVSAFLEKRAPKFRGM